MFEDNKKNNLKNNCSNLFLVFLLFVSINLKNCENSLFGEKKTLEIDSDRYTLDLVIKLKNEFSDDWISDLFAETYGLKKIARVSINKIFGRIFFKMFKFIFKRFPT